MKSYVTQQPNSNTNRTGSYRVVEWGAWRKYVDGETSYLPATSFSTQEEADAERDRLNAEAGGTPEVCDGGRLAGLDLL